MKVYSPPASCPTPAMSWGNDINGSMKSYDKAIEQHKIDLKELLVKQGYTGPLTGRVVRFSVADGYAEYMIADVKPASKAFLIHLAYYDGYSYRGIEGMNFTTIKKELQHQDAMDKLFRR